MKISEKQLLALLNILHHAIHVGRFKHHEREVLQKLSGMIATQQSDELKEVE